MRQSIGSFASRRLCVTNSKILIALYTWKSLVIISNLKRYSMLKLVNSFNFYTFLLKRLISFKKDKMLLTDTS